MTSSTLTPLLVGTFRVLYRPSFDELAPLRAVAERHSGERRSFTQWRQLLENERGMR